MAYLARTVSNADGAQTAFPVSFPLPPQQGRAGVKVYVRSVTDPHPGAAKVSGVDYNWVSDGQIAMVAAPAAGLVVDIRRATQDNALDNTPQPGGSLRAIELTQNDTQLIYLIQEREDADADLQGQVDAEVAARLLNENTLAAADTAEAAARIAADNALSGSVTAESNARSAADGVLQNNINAEAAARVAGDAAVGVRVTTETAQRVSGDTGLQGQVNGLLAQLTAILSSLGSSVALTSLPLVALSMPALKALDTSHGLPAMYVEDGKSGLFALKAIDAAKIAADPTNIIYAASNIDVTKMWVRQHEGRINVQWAGAKLDNVTNDGSAILAAQALADALYTPNTMGYGHGAAMSLYFPFGVGYMGSTQLNPLNSIKWSGNFAYDASAPVSGLRWDDNVCGVISDNPGFFVEGLAFYGGYNGGASDGSYPAIWSGKRMLAVRCAFYNWRGDGLKFDCTRTAGNVNDAGAMFCVFQNTRDSIQVVTGSDNSALNFYACNVLSSRRNGINDNTFLGNTHTAHQLQGASATAYNDGVTEPCAMCTYGGNRYMAISANAGANAPSGTTADTADWAFIAAGGAFAGGGIVAWFAGMLTQMAFPLRVPNLNGVTAIVGVYREGGQPLCWISQPAVVLGGNMAIGGTWKGATGILAAAATLHTNNGLKSSKPFVHSPVWVTDETYTVQLSESASLKTILNVTGSVTSPATWRFKGGADLYWDYGNNGTARWLMTGPTTAEQFGTGAAFPYAMYHQSLMIGPSSTNARLMSNATAAPTTGAHAQGEVYWNRSAAVGQPKGWMCTVAGTPGTWVSMGNL